MLTITPQSFAQNVGVKTDRTFGGGFRKSSGALLRIYEELLTLYGCSKVQLDARWSSMVRLMKYCEWYLDDKRKKGSDMNKAKYRYIDQLGQEVTAQWIKERNKAQGYGALVNAGAARGGIAMGTQGTHTTVRYEKAFVGNKKDGAVVNGHELYQMAQEENVKLTGDDNRDAYILRAFLKQKFQSAKFNLERLEYLNTDQQRARYELEFSATQVWQNSVVFDTTPYFVEGEVGAATMVISETGEWYARAGRLELIAGKWHHSSFLGGEAVMLAGTIRTSPAGTLVYISNNSGHYAPNLAQLLNGADQIPLSGLDRATRHKCSILASDFEGRYGPPARYLFPYTTFRNTRGAVPNPANYQIREKFSEFFWQYPGAIRPHCPCTTLGDGKIGYPA